MPKFYRALGPQHACTSRYPANESESTNGLTLRSRRHAAVRWSGASAPRASRVHVAVWSARGGRVRLSERTLGGPNMGREKASERPSYGRGSARFAESATHGQRYLA